MTKNKKAKQQKGKKTSKLKKWSLIGFSTTAVLTGILTAGGEKITEFIFSDSEEEKQLKIERQKNQELTSSLSELMAENKAMKEKMEQQAKTDKVYALWDKNNKTFKYFHEITHYDSNVMSCLANGNVSYLMSTLDDNGNSIVVPMKFNKSNRGFNNKLVFPEILKPELLVRNAKKYGPLLTK
ncbi:MAG: hypothetical protein OIF36_04040 [Alphaproteobacteria bacterium]|jgi:hypothetical protein|nr:hypothetical protein [Alphaproteobacteria bacterium]MCV6599630.1 hypothetical protein [Alphaproteobacteria bacterium]